MLRKVRDKYPGDYSGMSPGDRREDICPIRSA